MKMRCALLSYDFLIQVVVAKLPLYYLNSLLPCRLVPRSINNVNVSYDHDQTGNTYVVGRT